MDEGNNWIRGPYEDTKSVLVTGAEKEFNLNQFGSEGTLPTLPKGVI